MIRPGRFRFRLWAQISVTLLINLALLGALAAITIALQTRRGVDSFLYAQARERIRDLGAIVEDEFPGKSAAERDAWLADLEQQYGVSFAVYNDGAERVAGSAQSLPDAVRREIDRDARTRRAGNGRRRAASAAAAGIRRPPPIFTIAAGGLYWIGYHFPIPSADSESPPQRHTLLIVTDSLLRSPLLFDWRPWAAGISGAIAVSVLCWFPFLRRTTASLRAIEHASSEIARGRFDSPIPVRGHDELADLAQSIRGMSGQLNRLVNGQRRFLADVAHELCAPVARMQLRSGILEQMASGQEQPASSDALSRQIQRLESDVTHMSGLVHDLLAFTRDQAREPLLEAVSLADVVHRAAVQENADDNACIEQQFPEDAKLYVLADEQYLLRAVANLIRNAIRYAAGHGPVRISASVTSPSHTVRLVIADEGPGVPEAELDAVMSPFYTLDPARTPGANSGAGLGLAIVKSCLEACNGTIQLRNRKPHGLEAIIELQAATRG